MAIRRPSISSPEWLFQDFLYQAATAPGGSELRYVQIKWDGEIYERVSQSFDYSDPPFVGSEQRGGSIVGQIDYELNASTGLVTIYSWSVNWRDEWPLRLALTYLSQCIYSQDKRYTIRVAGNEVYSQAGDTIEVPSKYPYAFWVSERYNPLDNEPDTYLVRPPVPPAPPSPTPESFTFESFVQITVPRTYILVTITSEGVPIQTPLYWRITGDITPAMLVDNFTKGLILINASVEFLELPLVRPVLPGPTGLIEFYSDYRFTNLVGSTSVTL